LHSARQRRTKGGAEQQQRRLRCPPHLDHYKVKRVSKPVPSVPVWCETEAVFPRPKGGRRKYLVPRYTEKRRKRREISYITPSLKKRSCTAPWKPCTFQSGQQSDPSLRRQGKRRHHLLETIRHAKTRRPQDYARRKGVDRFTPRVKASRCRPSLPRTCNQHA